MVETAEVQVVPIATGKMRVMWDVPITMDDGITLRADVFLPEAEGRYPVVMNAGPYAKGLAYQEGYAMAYGRMTESYPETRTGTTDLYMNWETVDPEHWTVDGYVCVRIDNRGSGRSPGKIDLWGPREIKDYHDCIEWAAEQPWCNGKVGLNGISYFAMNQWLVAATKPPHLAAISIWEGASDQYRDMSHHGGILCTFLDQWFDRQVAARQYGVSVHGSRSRITGQWVSGDVPLSAEELAANRLDPMEEARKRPLDGPYYREHSANFKNITVPVLSAANWGGTGMHPRGNYEGYLGASSTQKWLSVHGDTHFGPFYRASGVDMQKQFLGHFLKGEDNGWDKQPPVLLDIRRPGEHFTTRAEREWPLARTEWTKFYLDPTDMSLRETPRQAAAVTYDPMGNGLFYYLPTSEKEVEITGPIVARLWVSSETADADLFLVLRLYDPDGKEILFVGSNDPRMPITFGWLRASHRKLAPEKSLPHRPYHSHDELWPLTPGEPVELLIEVWPTCIVVPPGYRLALNIRGKDYDNGLGDAKLADAPYPMTGVGPFHHNDPSDRPPAIFSGKVTLHFDEGKEPWIELPIIPQQS